MWRRDSILVDEGTKLESMATGRADRAYGIHGGAFRDVHDGVDACYASTLAKTGALSSVHSFVVSHKLFARGGVRRVFTHSHMVYRS